MDDIGYLMAPRADHPIGIYHEKCLRTSDLTLLWDERLLVQKICIRKTACSWLTHGRHDRGEP